MPPPATTTALKESARLREALHDKQRRRSSGLALSTVRKQQGPPRIRPATQQQALFEDSLSRRGSSWWPPVKSDVSSLPSHSPTSTTAFVQSMPDSECVGRSGRRWRLPTPIYQHVRKGEEDLADTCSNSDSGSDELCDLPQSQSRRCADAEDEARHRNSDSDDTIDGSTHSSIDDDMTAADDSERRKRHFEFHQFRFRYTLRDLNALSSLSSPLSLLPSTISATAPSMLTRRPVQPLKCKVRFIPMVETVRIHHWSSFTEQERADAWYSSEEFMEMKCRRLASMRQNRAPCFIVSHRELHQLNVGTSDSLSVSQRRQRRRGVWNSLQRLWKPSSANNHDDGRYECYNNTETDRRVCPGDNSARNPIALRNSPSSSGIENEANQSVTRSAWAKYVVLEEQWYQREQNINDPVMIAELYAEHAHICARHALQRGRRLAERLGLAEGSRQLQQ